MFKEIMNLGSMMKKAQELTGKMNELKDQMKNVTAKGTAGGGMVETLVNGQFELISCKIDESLLTVDNRELLEDMIIAAVNEAGVAVKAKIEAEMGSLTSGFDLNSLMEKIDPPA